MRPQHMLGLAHLTRNTRKAVGTCQPRKSPGKLRQRPPRSPSDPDQYAELIAALRKRPGDWAVVDTFENDDPAKAASTAYRLAKAIKEGKKGFAGPNVKFESRTHKATKTSVKVYARCVAVATLTAVPNTAAAAEPEAAQ